MDQRAEYVYSKNWWLEHLFVSTCTVGMVLGQGRSKRCLLVGSWCFFFFFFHCFFHRE